MLDCVKFYTIIPFLSNIREHDITIEKRISMDITKKGDSLDLMKIYLKFSGNHKILKY